MFTEILLAAVLTAIFPKTKNVSRFAAPLMKVATRFEINTPLRMAAFLAQVGHESGGLSVFRENLNYSADALMRVWPKHFPSRLIAEQYHRQPERIANRAYANRMGNGPEQSGEGWKFRGRGAIQLTGKHNVTNFAAAMKMTVDEAIAYLETDEGAMMSAGWFWSTNSLNRLADDEAFLSLTKRINGGTIGLADREDKYRKARSAFGI